MAFKKKCFYEIFVAVLVLFASLSTASGVDCRGKSFHCVNSTHFMICVDLGGGVSQSIDDFLIPCPPPTICHGTNHFECEFPAPTSPLPVLNVISETTQPWEDVVVTTNSPQRKTTKEYSEKYVNTESLSFGDSFTTDSTVYTTEAPLPSASIDLNDRINITETISTLLESNVYETTTTVDTLTESISIYDTTSNLDPVPQIIFENVTTEVATEIPLVDIPTVAPPSPVPQTISETITTEVATEIPLVDIPTLAPFNTVPQTIPENVITEVTTEISLVDIPTVAPPSPVPQTIPENITTEVATEIPLVDIPTVAPPSPVPQTISETINTEVVTEIPLVDIPTLAPFNPVPQTIPENITTEVTTEISLVDIPTVEPTSPVPQTIPENISTEVATEIPLIYIPAEVPSSLVSQTIPENVTTEVTTEIPLGDIPTVASPSPVPQAISETITTEVATEIPLIDIPAEVPPSLVSQTIPENFTTEVKTAIPLVDTTTVAPPSPVPQTISENIATEVTTDISLVDITTSEVIVKDAAIETTPFTISPNDSSLNINVNVTVVPANTASTILNSNTTNDNKQVYPETPIDTNNFIGSEQVVTNPPEETYRNEANANNQFGFTEELIPNGPIVEQTTASYLAFENENQPTTIGPEILTTDTTFNLAIEPSQPYEENPLNQQPTTVDTVVEQESVTNKSISTQSPSSAGNNQYQKPMDVVYITKRPLIVTGQDQDQSILTDDKAHFTTENTQSIKKTDIVPDVNAENKASIHDKTQTKTSQTIKNQEEKKPTSGTDFNKDQTEFKPTKSTIVNTPIGEDKKIPSLQNKTNRTINNQEERKSTTESGVSFIPDLPTADTKKIVSSQNKKPKDINQPIIDQEEKNSLPETGFPINATETKLPKSTTVDLPSGKNNVLANTTFDTVIVPAVESTQSPTSTVFDGNFQTVANEIATETTIFASNDQVTVDEVLGTEKSIFIDDNSVVIENPNLIIEKDSKNTTAQFTQDQEALVIENGYAATEQPNINTFDSAVTTENVIYLPIDTSFITTSEGFQAGIQSLGITTEQPVTVTFDEQLPIVATNNVATERPIITTTNEQVPIQSNNENSLRNKEKSIFINNDTVAFGNSNSLKVINKTQEATTEIPQDQVMSTAEIEYIPHGIVTVQPEIIAVTTDSAIYKNILQNDQSTTVTGITTEGHPGIVSSTATAVEEVIFTTDATVGVNQDKFVAPYDSVPTMATIANASETIHTSVKDISDKLNIGNSPTWQDTAKGEAKEKSASVLLNDTATNSDSATTELNNSPLDGINKVIDSINTEIQFIGSNLNVKETSLTDTKETGIKLEMPSETSSADHQIITIDNTEVHDFISTTENIYAINESGLKPIETVTIDDTNAVGQNTQDTENPSSILNVPITDNNIISQTNENNGVTINKHATNTRTDAVDTTISEGSLIGTVTTVKTVSSGNTWLELTNNNAINQQSQTTSQSIDNGTPNVNKNIEGSINSNQISSSSQVNSITDQFIHNSEQTNVAGVLGTDTLPDDKITTESNQSQIGSSGLGLMGNNMINHQSQPISQSIDNGIPNVNNNVAESLNSQGNTDIDQSNHNLEQTNVAGVLGTNTLQDVKTTTQSNQGQIGSSGLDTVENNIINQISQTTSTDNGTTNKNPNIEGNIHSNLVSPDPQKNTMIDQFNHNSEQTSVAGVTAKEQAKSHQGESIIDNNIINEISQTTTQSIDKGTSNILNSFDGSANIKQITSDTKANTITNQVSDDKTTTEMKQSQTNTVVHSELGDNENNNNQNPTTSGSIDKGTSNVLNILGGSNNNIASNPLANTIINNVIQDLEKTNAASILAKDDNDHTTLISVNSRVEIPKNNMINQESQTISGTIERGTSNILTSGTDSKHIISDEQVNTATDELNQDSKLSNVGSILVTSDKKFPIETNDQVGVTSGLDVPKNNVIKGQSQITSGSIDKGTSNVLKNIEGGTDNNQIVPDSQANTITNKLNGDSVGSNVVSISLKEDKTITSEMNQGQTSLSVTGLDIPKNNNEQRSESIDKGTPNILKNVEGGTDTNHIVADSQTKTITNIYPQIIDGKSSNVVVAHGNENLHSTGIENSGTFATETTNTVNNPADSRDVSSSSSPETDNKTKFTVLETVQSVLQTIGNVFNTASNNSSSVTGHSDNRDESNILPTDISELDVNTKRGSTESAPVNKYQTDESINIIRQVATVVPFDEASLSTNNDKDQVSQNVHITKPIISHISPGTFESISNNKVVTVVEPVSLDILAAETTKSDSSGTINDNTVDSLATINSKVNKIEITAKPYKPVTSNPGTIISRTTTIPNNVVQKSDASVVPKTEGISFVKQPEPTVPSISEKTIINGNGAGIGTVLANNNLNAKPNDHVIAQENTVHGSIPIQGAGSSVINGMNILPSIDITSLFTDSADKKDLSNNGIISGLVSETARDKKSSTYENNNAGIRNPSVVAGKINENLSSNINQQNELPAQQYTTVNAVEKKITQSPIPIHATTSTGTVYPRNNSAAVVNNMTHLATNTNVNQKARANITGQINNQVAVAKKPVKSTTQASVRKTVPKPVSNVTENHKKQIVNNTLNFSCISGIRGRYSDKYDCRKFYICVGTVGNTQPIVGHCPVNTVFSDIKKQCTKNMSHCIRENEFKCPSGGRFSDVIKENVYYICINHNSHLYRFKFQCQPGFTLNKTTVRCIENKEVESNESVSISSDNASDSSSQSASSSSTSSISTSSSSSSSSSSGSSTASSSSNTSSDSESTSSKSKKKKEKSESKDGDDDDDVFECEKEGKFRVKNDCKRYYLCKKNRKGEYRRKLKKCESGEVFHKKKRKCVDEDDYEC